ncbi:uncharacterized protein SOCE26_075200 [Sorangium cellulosum]|uniref:Uncharacterized protein n=1 Tax=Sorangium cellulosum TaxID=56 RepID=A0A2L0F3A8_SORCE|nr:kelch repeat-containing protein [Sorangium cellulosum]AUX46017.1 uncharacterized protein SOCE26_075200 [Sorangium cellulosum]
MHSRCLSRGVVLLSFVLLLLLGALVGCSSEGEPAPGSSEALRARFPGQVREVLETRAGFVATGEGFIVRSPRAGRGFRPASETIEAVLPARGEEGLRLRGQKGFALTVRELGAAGEGTIEGGAVTYARAGGRSYWTVMEGGGVEEWLLLEAEAVSRGAPVAVWQVEGAALRQQGEAVEVVDEEGRARLRVTAPRAYAEGGRDVKARIEAIGERIELWVPTSGEAMLVDPVWLPAGEMSAARGEHTATLLPGGQVLVAGGVDPGDDALGSAELYDPQTDRWSSARAMSTARSLHTATLLPGGQVLVAGGVDPGDDALGSAELYDPQTDRWSSARAMSTARSLHTATLLPGGQVLVAGGVDPGDDALGGAELYDPQTDRWSSARAMSMARSLHTATLLPDGQVLVAGGVGPGGDALRSAELYNPQTDKWTSVVEMSIARRQHSATLLPGGQVLVAGGIGPDGRPLASAELYDPAARGWQPAGLMLDGRAGHTATRLPSGQVLVAGGDGPDRRLLASAELYDPVIHSWLPAGAMGIARHQHTATLLPSGHVLVAGGLTHSSPVERSLDSAELYAPTPSSWVQESMMRSIRRFHTATLLPSGQVLVAGVGGVAITPSDDPADDDVGRLSADLYDPATRIWQPTGEMHNARYGHAATLLPSGQVLVAGGWFSSYIPDTELYDPSTQRWEQAGQLTVARTEHTMTLLLSGQVLVAGGDGGFNGVLASAELYDPVARTWAPTGEMNTRRREHTATLLPTGEVLVAGGYDGPEHDGPGVSDDPDVFYKTAEIYDTNKSTWRLIDSMHHARHGHTATLLPSGQVLVAGGNGYDGYLASAELYDPMNDTWTRTGAMSGPREGHTATLLPSGQVLVAGGYGPAGSLASAELYDPTKGEWQPAGSMSVPHAEHTATLLRSGQVLVAGGFGSSGHLLANADLYDPAGRWEGVAPMAKGRVHLATAYLPSGNVLVAGGVSSAGYEASVEVYAPATRKWVPANPHRAMSTARAHHTATLLLSGQVLVAGGYGPDGYLGSTELYDPMGDLWTLASAMSTARAYHTATLLRSGQVLIAGGYGPGGHLAYAELYKPASGSFRAIGSMTTARERHTATRLPSGDVLVAGGWGQRGAVEYAEVYHRAGARWEQLRGTMIHPRAGHTATLLRNGRVLLTGGVTMDGPLANAELFDPDATARDTHGDIMYFSLAASMLHARTGHIATLMPDGRVLVAGGADTSGPLSSAEVYDPDGDVWAEVRPLTTSRNEPVTPLRENADAREDGDVLDDGSVLVLGGRGEGEIPLATVERFESFPAGMLCGQATDCQSGFCVDGVCCNTACGAGTCDICSVRTEVTFPVGARQPGTCELLTGPTCDDGNACTRTDTCSEGACKGADEVVCPADACQQASQCDPRSGTCAPAVNGRDDTPCDDGNECTEEDSCSAGTCRGAREVNCACSGCEPYVCFGASRSCRATCDSVNDCAPGYVCDRDHACVAPPPDRYSRDNTGCALAPPGAPGGSPWPSAALSLLALGALGVGRRSARPRARVTVTRA